MTDSQDETSGEDSTKGDSTESEAVDPASTETIPVAPPESPTDPAAESMQADQRGVIDGRYEVIALLGHGSMGNVYKVRDRRLDEIVALKSLRERFAGQDEAIEQFRREVKMARRVTHRNVARTFDIGISGDLPYLTMEYIDGESLGRLLRTGGVLEAEAFFGFVEPICRALQAAHQVGIVHRDLKPDNVMVTDAGRVVVTDFGLAHQTSGDDGDGERRLGTPGYMAPEQVEQRGTIDARADIYALGIIMYEMLTGELPWDGKNATAVAFARCVQPPPELPDEGGWPESLRRIVTSCLQRDRVDRFQSAARLLDALEEVRADDLGVHLPDRQLADEADEAPQRATEPYEKTVAVLPLDYEGPDDGEYLAAGVTEEIIDELSRADGLAVLPRGAVGRFESAEVDPREAGRQLGVQAVVEGSLRRYGETLQVRAAVTSVDEGFQLWGETFEAEPAELLEVGQKAARAALRAMTVSSSDRERTVPSDPVAIDVYMRGRHAMKEGWYTDLDQAIALFERALDRAPDDPRILSGLATARARASFLDHPNRQRHVADATETARRAIAAAPDWPEPHVAVAMARYNGVEFGRALEALDRALECAPDFFEAHELRGRILAEVGPLERAAEHLERALEYNPYLYNARWDLARVHALLGDWEAVDEWMDRPVDSESARILRHAHRARFDVWREEPRWADRPATPSVPDGSEFEEVPAVMRSVARGSELTDEQKARLDGLLDHHGDDSRYLSMQYQLRVETGARAGDREYALAHLERACQAGLVDINWLTYCPVLEGLDGHPRFESVRETVEERLDRMLDT